MFLKIPPLAIGRNGLWTLTDTLIYRTANSDIISVPADFETDLASIPRFLTPLVPPNGRHRAAAIVHDWLYCNRGKLRELTFTRAESDGIFLEAMSELGVSWWRRWMMYFAVRLGGFFYWGRE